jgi:hypothetical protein
MNLRRILPHPFPLPLGEGDSFGVSIENLVTGFAEWILTMQEAAIRGGERRQRGLIE